MTKQKREPNWLTTHTVYLTEGTELTVEQWATAEPDSPDGLSLSLTTNFLAWAGTEREQWKTDTASTIYGLSLSELEQAAADLLGICQRIRQEAR